MTLSRLTHISGATVLIDPSAVAAIVHEPQKVQPKHTDGTVDILATQVIEHQCTVFLRGFPNPVLIRGNLPDVANALGITYTPEHV